MRREDEALIVKQITQGTPPELIAERYGLTLKRVKRIATKHSAEIRAQKEELLKAGEKTYQERLLVLRNKILSTAEKGLDALEIFIEESDDPRFVKDATLGLLRAGGFGSVPVVTNNQPQTPAPLPPTLIQRLIVNMQKVSPQEDLPMPEVPQTEFSTQTIPQIVEGEVVDD